MSSPRLVLPAFLLGLGTAIAGALIAQALPRIRPPERLVTMKGIAEREVVADTALWPIAFSATADDLVTAQATLAKSRGIVSEFLARHGIEASSVQVQRLTVRDRQASDYGDAQSRTRYVLRQTLMVRSNDAAKVRATSQAVGELVEAGVVLGAENEYRDGPTYLFTKLNDLKPEMIREATAAARRAAEEFGRDSGARVGAIRRASQGLFEILPRDRAPGADEAEQMNKTVRVVSTIDFELED